MRGASLHRRDVAGITPDGTPGRIPDAPPWRAWYSVAEASQMLGVTTAHLYDLIRKGKWTEPPPGAISPELVRTIGAKVCLARRYIFRDEPANLIPLPAPEITEQQLEEIATRVVRRVFAGLGHLAEPTERTG